MNNLPNLTMDDYDILEDLRKNYPRAFRQNKTDFLTNEMRRYILDKKIWRMSIMGEVRMGKSEVGSTFGLLYTLIFNEQWKLGQFKNLDVFDNTKLKNKLLEFNSDYIVGGQEDYIYGLRNMYNDGKLSFGQVFQIDEARDSIGGLGSFSTEIDLKNINNIVAKYMISEIWITPDKFVDRNTPYGLYVYKKDLVNKVNWCLLYKIQMKANMMRDYIFLGWVEVPLHKNEKLRKEYNLKKNKWISDEMIGKGDKRTIERKKASIILSKDPDFARMSVSGKQFALSKSQQISLMEDYVSDGRIQAFNELEKYRIVDEARMLIMKMQWKKPL